MNEEHNDTIGERMKIMEKEQQERNIELQKDIDKAMSNIIINNSLIQRKI